MMKALVPSAIILAAVLGGLFAVKSLVPAKPPARPGAFELKVGATAPDFELTPVATGPKSSFSKVPGKLLLVNFWATWCEACMVELPSISELREKFHEKGFEVVGVNLDENPEAAESFARAKLGLKFPIFVDPENKLSDLFDVHGIPLTFILDRSGKVLLVETGERDWYSKEIQDQVEGWLKQ